MMSTTALGCEIITTWEAPTTTPDSSERLNHRTLGRCHEPALCCGKIGRERRQNIARGTRGAANASSRGFTFDLHIARIPESAGGGGRGGEAQYACGEYECPFCSFVAAQPLDARPLRASRYCLLRRYRRAACCTFSDRSSARRTTPPDWIGTVLGKLSSMASIFSTGS
jgi:hypothetical protein